MRSSSKLLALPLVVFAAVFAVACAAPPKQSEVPDAEGGTGEDMAPTEAAPTPVEADAKAEPAGGATEMHEKCCASCKEGLAKDRTGAKPETIPCADFTDTLSPWCLEHFRSTPTMASECK